MKYCKLFLMYLIIGMILLNTSLSVNADGYFPAKAPEPLTPDGNALLVYHRGNKKRSLFLYHY